MVRLDPRSLRVLSKDGAPDTIRSVEGVDHVGAFLREARETTELSVADVAKALHIRRVYLEAIEDGRFEELPGTAYAVGFVRSYATYLRLDVLAIVERFKREATGIEVPLELDFPAAGPEGRFPGGVVATACLVLAGAGFGGWYWWQNQNSLEVARVPAPPEVQTGTPVENEQVDNSVSKNPVPEVRQVPSSYTDPVIDPLADVPPENLKTLEVAAVKPVAPQMPAGVGTSTGVEPSVLALPAAGPRAIPSLSEASENGPARRTYGAVNRDARIILSARDSGTWVQVMDGQGNALLTQMLELGDRYLVPDRSGLRLRTNNAGGLDILVDGASVPAIGSRGDVRHDVQLDPELLKSGAAVIK